MEGAFVFPKIIVLDTHQHIHFSHPTVREEACSVLVENEEGWLETHKVEAILSGLALMKKA